MFFRRSKTAHMHAEKKGKQIDKTRKEYIATVETTKKNLEQLNKILDNGITLKIKSAMGGKHAR